MLAGYSGERDHSSTKRFRNTGISTVDKATRSGRRTMRPWTRPKKRVGPRRCALRTRWAASAAFLLAYVLNEINAVAPAGTEGSAAVKEMLKLQTAQLDEFIVRLKAKHNKPREGRPWARSLTLAEVVPAEMREHGLGIASITLDAESGSSTSLAQHMPKVWEFPSRRCRVRLKPFVRLL